MSVVLDLPEEPPKCGSSWLYGPQGSDHRLHVCVGIRGHIEPHTCRCGCAVFSPGRVTHPMPFREEEPPTRGALCSPDLREEPPGPS